MDQLASGAAGHAVPGRRPALELICRQAHIGRPSPPLNDIDDGRGHHAPVPVELRPRPLSRRFYSAHDTKTTTTHPTTTTTTMPTTTTTAPPPSGVTPRWDQCRQQRHRDHVHRPGWKSEPRQVCTVVSVTGIDSTGPRLGGPRRPDPASVVWDITRPAGAQRIGQADPTDAHDDEDHRAIESEQFNSRTNNTPITNSQTALLEICNHQAPVPGQPPGFVRRHEPRCNLRPTRGVGDGVLLDHRAESRRSASAGRRR